MFVWKDNSMNQFHNITATLIKFRVSTKKNVKKLGKSERTCAIANKQQPADVEQIPQLILKVFNFLTCTTYEYFKGSTVNGKNSCDLNSCDLNRNTNMGSIKEHGFHTCGTRAYLLTTMSLLVRQTIAAQKRHAKSLFTVDHGNTMLSISWQFCFSHISWVQILVYFTTEPTAWFVHKSHLLLFALRQAPV